MKESQPFVPPSRLATCIFILSLGAAGAPKKNQRDCACWRTRASNTQKRFPFKQREAIHSRCKAYSVHQVYHNAELLLQLPSAYFQCVCCITKQRLLELCKASLNRLPRNLIDSGNFSLSIRVLRALDICIETKMIFSAASARLAMNRSVRLNNVVKK